MILQEFKNTVVDVLVVGSGISGMIVSKELSDKGINHMVIERSSVPVQPQLHYFHRDDSDFFGEKLQRVEIQKALFWDGKFENEFNIEMHNHYSYITTGKLFVNSSKYVGTTNEAWIPKGGDWRKFYNNLQSKCFGVTYDCELLSIDSVNKVADVSFMDGDQRVKTSILYNHLMSTIPMPVMLKIARVRNEVEFKFDELIVDQFQLDQDECDPSVHQIIYFPQADFGYARASLLGNRVVCERANSSFMSGSQHHLFVSFLHRWMPSLRERERKIQFETSHNPGGRYIGIDEVIRSEYVELLESRNIHSVGRYAQWVYKRADHVIDDVQAIVEGIKGLPI